LNRKLYHTGEFAKILSVSVRALQYYDKIGLLSPSEYTDAGHRLYSDDDISKLQQILALKYLGFSLRDIKGLMKDGTGEFLSALRAQKAMLLDKRRQIDSIVTVIEQIEQSEQIGQGEQIGQIRQREQREQVGNKVDYNAVVKIIGVIQMDLKPEWVSKYLTPDERKTMRDIAKQSFSKEALRKLGQREFTEQTHKQYGYFRNELRRLVASNADPASEAAQKLARYLVDLNNHSSGGDKEILAGMKKSWEGFNELPDDKKPQIYILTTKEREFIKEACAILFRNF
jgi:MerR family transcriptional regulator, thiopeptide resistance regulator